MAGTDPRDPREDYKHLLNELELYDKAMLKKPRLVVANKIDLPEAGPNLATFKRKYRSADVLEISCLSGDGLDRLKKELLKRVTKFRRAEKASQVATA
jgi:GTP-binding protein